MEHENNSSGDIREIKETLARIAETIAKQDERLSRLEHSEKIAVEPMFETYGRAEKHGLPPPPPPPPPPATVRPLDLGELSFRGNDENEREKPEPVSVNEDHRDFEEKMGVTWFSRIGMVALVLGASFFLKYAFDNNWIGPTGRVMIGIVAGFVLLGLGEKFIKKYFDYGQLLTGGGISVLYLSLYAALNFYHLISPSVAFAFMALVTAAGALLSVRYNALPLMIFSAIGGFVTPSLVSTGTNQQVALLSYILLLDIAIFGVSFFKRWHAVQFLGFIGTFFIFGGWMNSFYTVSQIWSTFIFATLFFFVYSFTALAYNITWKEESTGAEQMLALFAGIVYFATSYGILNEQYHAYMGFFALSLAIYYFLWANVCKSITPKDSMLYNFLAFLSVGFITLAISIQFKSNVITLCWFVEAVLLTYAGIESKNYLIKQAAVFVTALPIVRLLVIDYDIATTGTFLLNERFFTYLFGIVSLYLLAYLWKQDRESGESKTLAIIATLAANFFTLMAGSLEIAYYYRNAISAVQNNMAWFQDIKLSNEAGNGIAVHDMTMLKIHEGIVLSFYWILYAMALLSVGIFRKLRHLRLSGYVLLMVALLKFTVADVWRIGELPISERIGIYVFIIVVLYGVSYVWSKYTEDTIQAKKLVAAFAIFANLFTLYAGGKEISYHYGKLIDAEQTKISQNYGNNNSGGSQLYNSDAEYKQIDRLYNRQSVAFSIFWILYAVLLLVVGIVKKARYVRLGGLFLLSFAILKLFMYDLWGLGTLYRIISSMTLGVVLLSVSYAYQKFKDQIKTII
ncbi:MAG: DUF2339 domain-containing protein [Candidatus Paceibacterota bacterium]|jgi:uncharacterized membrane protein